MDRETFDRILTEEGVDDAKLRDDIWKSRPLDLCDNEDRLRKAAKDFKAELLYLLARRDLKRAMDREFGRE